MTGELNQQAGYRFASRRLAEADAPPRLARLLATWRAQCGPLAIPPPHLARFEPFTFALGHIHLIDVLPEGGFHFRIFGTASSHPLDLHKRDTADIRPLAFRDLVEADYATAVERGGPILHSVELAGPRRSGIYRRILLPYAEPGQKPSLLVSGIEEEPGVADVFRDPAFRADPILPVA
jgi:hypothetical protein